MDNRAHCDPLRNLLPAVTQVKIPPVQDQTDLVTDEERKVYARAGSTWVVAVPWAEGPRRLGADKNGHVIWVCDWWGGSLTKIDTRSLKVTVIPLPRPDAQQPYQAQVDSSHNVWINLMNADEVVKFDPKSSKWVEYPFPTLGAETRYLIFAGERRRPAGHSSLFTGQKSRAHDLPHRKRFGVAKGSGSPRTGPRALDATCSIRIFFARPRS